MFRRDGVLDRLHLQVQRIQRGQLGLQAGQRFQYRAIGIFDVGQPRVAQFFNLADQLDFLLVDQTVAASRSPNARQGTRMRIRSDGRSRFCGLPFWK